MFLPNTSLAGGPVHGAKAAAMGTAFVAIADDPSAILYNPAGLTNSKGTNVYSGATLVTVSSEYQNPAGLAEDTKFQVFFPPHLYASSDFHTDSLVFGVGLLSPFGIGGRKWSEQGLTRYAATENTVSTFAVNPTAAWQVTPWLSVGAGVYYLHAFADSSQMVDQSAMAASDGKMNLEIDGGGWGYDLGILLFQGQKVSLGLAYRSSAQTDLSGSLSLERVAPALQSLFGGSQFKTAVDSSLEFPQVLSVGIAYRPAPAWTLALDAEWGGWSSFDKLHLHLKDEVAQAGFSDSTIEFRYQDAWQIKIGLEYQFNERFALRTGYAYVMSNVTEATLSPGNPDADQHNFSVGFGYKKNKLWLDAFYMIDVFQDRNVTNSILSGDYQSLGHMLGFSMGYRF